MVSIRFFYWFERLCNSVRRLDRNKNTKLFNENSSTI